MLIESQKQVGRHPLAGKPLRLGTSVYRYTDLGGTVLVAVCLSTEAAEAVVRLLSM